MHIVDVIKIGIYVKFARLIKEIQPKTWIMENVPGLKSKKMPDGSKVLDRFMEYIKNKDHSDLQGIITEIILQRK